MSDKNSNIEQSTLNRVPENEKMGWKAIALIQIGVMICVPSLMLGGLLAEAMDFKSAILATLLGYGFTVLVTIIMGFQGCDLGVPTIVLATSAFGKKGSRIILSALFAISLIGWFALQTNVCGAAFTNLMYSSFNISIPLWLSTGVWGTIMLITAVYGIKALEKLNNFSVPALLAVSAYGMYLAIQKFGLTALTTTQVSTMSILQGATLTFSFTAVGAVIAADFTRYQKSRSDTIKSTFYGILPAGLFMMTMGYVMSKVSGNFDITMVMADIGIPLMGLIVLVLATWTTNTTNSYSAGINMVMLFNTKDDKRAVMTLIAGALGTVLAIAGAADYFQNFLYWVGSTFTPVAGVMIADYWILRKGEARCWSPVEGIDISAIISWTLGVIVTSTISNDYAILIGMVTSILIFIGLKKLVFNVEYSAEQPIISLKEQLKR